MRGGEATVTLPRGAWGHVADITLLVRYCRLYWDEDVPHREEHFTLVEQTFTIPVESCALVLVDCWDGHYIDSHLERTNQIIDERILPTINACREAGVAVIHAPSPPMAKKYRQWVAYASDQELDPKAATAPEWPPAEFRNRTGEFECFAKPAEDERDEWVRTGGAARLIVDTIAPQPGDSVITTGDHLHRLLTHKRITHLLYAGFAANMCVPGRDYGTRAMNERGYNCILLRDCTTAIEGPGSWDGMTFTKASILEHEMIIGHTATSEAVIEACGSA